MDLILYIFIAILALSALVFFHELGHFLVARAFGVTVERFSIGFGKVLYSKKWAGTEWAFAPILLGGYVKMKGQDDANPLAKSSDPDSYNSKKPWQKILILLAGPFANFVLAFFIYLGIAQHGIPEVKKHIEPVIFKVHKDKPAFKAGLKSGDKIIEINNIKINDWKDVPKAIDKSKLAINLKVLRGSSELAFKIDPVIVNKRKIIGVEIDDSQLVNYKDIPFLETIPYALKKTKDAAFLITKGVKQVATGEVDSKNIGGAITIFDIIIKMAKEGWIYFLGIVALISVNLGVLNLLPIPALDGGHIMFNLYEMITRKDINEKVYMALTGVGWVFLLGLMFFGLYNDVNRIWG